MESSRSIKELVYISAFYSVETLVATSEQVGARLPEYSYKRGNREGEDTKFGRRTFNRRCSRLGERRC